ncbi:hypothetical protein D047_0097A, partial [Vibrio parahaemolyticus VPTS-2010_2]
MFSTYKNNLP